MCITLRCRLILLTDELLHLGFVGKGGSCALLQQLGQAVHLHLQPGNLSLGLQLLWSGVDGRDEGEDWRVYMVRILTPVDLQGRDRGGGEI